MSASAAPVFCLRGPTASGKTDLAVVLAERAPVDVISVDSAMIYRGMDIGTAKPSVALRQRVPHGLIDILDPAESYSAAAFRRDALREIRRSHARGRIPLLVGGTMLYFRALEEGLSRLPSADPALRDRLEREAATRGVNGMHAWLRKLDPASAERLHVNDSQRVQRALEVCLITGRPMSDLQAGGEGPPEGLALHRLAVMPAARSLLHQRIAERFHAMLEAGFEDEVSALRERGDLALNQPSMRAVGYRQMWLHMDGAYGRQEMIKRAVTATRQYAKRQLTWLRRDDTVRVLTGPHAALADDLQREIDRELVRWRPPTVTLAQADEPC